MTLHSHYDPGAGRFVEHDHLHSGAHDHELARRADGTTVVVVRRGPGNYSPHGLPENRSEAAATDDRSAP